MALTSWPGSQASHNTAKPGSETLGKSLRELYRPIASGMAHTEELLGRAVKESRHVIRPMASHLLRRPGKRIRAALVLFSARVGRADAAKVAQLAAAVEMLHVASLIHDDILDGAATRRNQPALHARWGTHKAVLMGDYLFARIFSLLAEHFPLPVTRSLLSAAHEVCDGAIEETSMAFRTDTTESRYLEIIGKKTGALTAAACECGAIVAGSSRQEQESLRRFGSAFGLAFQLVDDALNFCADPEEMGKPVGSDIAEGKFTMPVLSLRRLLKGSERRKLGRLLESSSLLNGGAGKIIELANSRGGVEYSLVQAAAYMKKAKESLAEVPPAAREPLRRLADYALRRRK
jgi:geranylgeranyl pyrophosphate synthase